MNICIICLHTDRQTKENAEIAKFHDEICNLTLYVGTKYYCYECEYILAKHFKFREKCVKALKIYKKWMTKKIKDPGINNLYKLLPPPSITKSLNIIKLEIKPIINLEEDTNLFVDVKVEDITQDNVTNENVCVFQSNIINITSKTETNHDNDIDNKNIDFDNDINVINASEFDNDSVEYKLKEECESDSEEKPKRVRKKCVAKTEKKVASDKAKSLDKNVKKRTKTVNCKKQKVASETTKSLKRRKKCDSTSDEELSLASEKIKLNKEAAEKKRGKKKKKTVAVTNNDLIVINKKHDFQSIVRIERLKDDLVEKLSSFGETVKIDDVSVDKELINKLTQHDAAEPVLKRLINTKCREDVIKLVPEIKSTLKTINNDNVEPDASLVYEVEYLTTLEKKMKEFHARKTYDHYVKAQDKCEICYQVFKGPNALERHTKKYHDESMEGQHCPICKMKFDTSAGDKQLTAHIAKHFAVYRCKLCPLVTYYRNTMKEHAEIHQGKIYRCDPCNVTYKCASAYYRHMSRYHRRGRLVCPACGRGFQSPRSLQVHTAVMHKDAAPVTEETGVKCTLCNVTLASQAVYAAHVTDVHDPPPATLPVTQPARDERDLPGYQALPHWPQKKNFVRRAVKKQKCRVCNLARPGFGWLKAHFKWTHPDEDMDVLYADTKRHLCDICGYGTSSIYNLRDHMNEHSGRLPHGCPLCPRRFKSRALVANHRLHHAAPTLPCPHCGKLFKSKANLYTHVKSHIGDRSFKCHMCDKGFLLSAALNEHIRGVHYKIRRVKRSKNADTGVDGRTEPKRGVIQKGEKILPEVEDFSSD